MNAAVTKEVIYMKSNSKLIKMILAALFLALAYIMPFLTGQIPDIGAMLCPMHIPVLLCGFVCGWPWGLLVGFIAPLLRSFLTGGFPPIFPTAVAMAFELAAYGAVSGLMHKILPKKRPYIYCSLVIAMAVGRAVWGIATAICLGISGKAFGIEAFFAGAIVNAIPGIALQIVLVPVIVMIFEKIAYNNRKSDSN